MIDDKVETFSKKAKPFIRKGYRVTPVIKGTKRSATGNWNVMGSFRATLIAEESFPDADVGLVSSRGIGRLCWLDIDGEGEIERIERQTGHKLPVGFRVKTRPKTAEWKQHLYFTQTAYSVRMFRKNANVKNMDIADAAGKHPTRYDLKGIGGAALVVAPGTLRSNGEEAYTVIDDSPVPPIPDWLIDWLVEDIRKYRIADAKERAEKREKKRAERAKYSPQQRLEMRREGLPAGFDIYEADIYAFLRTRSGSLASLGFDPADIEVCLAMQTRKFCVNGIAFVESEKGKAVLHKIAHDPKLHIKDASFFYEKKELVDEDEDDLNCSLVLKEGPTSRHKVMVEIIKTFPDSISSELAYQRLEEGLKASFAFDRRLAKDMVAAGKARKQAGFKSDNHGDGKYTWVRLESLG